MKEKLLSIIIIAIAILINYNLLSVHKISIAESLPNEFVDDREIFGRVKKLFNEAMDLTMPPDDSGKPFKISEEQENQIRSKLTEGIRLSKKIDDGFLDYLHPELKNYFRNKYIKAYELYLEGLNDMDLGLYSSGLEKQLQTAKLLNDFNRWWELNRETIINKAFPDEYYKQSDNISFWEIIIFIIGLFGLYTLIRNLYFKFIDYSLVKSWNKLKNIQDQPRNDLYKNKELLSFAAEFVEYSISDERTDDLIFDIEKVLRRKLTKDEEFKLRKSITIFIFGEAVYNVSFLSSREDEKIIFISHLRTKLNDQIFGWSENQIENYTTLLNTISKIVTKWFENIKKLPTEKDYENLWNELAEAIITTSFNFDQKINGEYVKQHLALRKIIEMKLSALHKEIKKKIQENINFIL